VVGDLTDADTLTDAVAGVDAVVFTHGANGDAERVNYAAARGVPGGTTGEGLAVQGEQAHRPGPTSKRGSAASTSSPSSTLPWGQGVRCIRR
jgi:uncharacterized protein YbjT (DUF2867 family)